LRLSPVSASVASVATPFGCLLCGPLLDRFGRRVALLALNLPFSLGWLTLAFTPTPVYTPLLYLGRILTGIGMHNGLEHMVQRPSGHGKRNAKLISENCN
jgi:MFS family permease